MLTDPARAMGEFRESLSLWNVIPIKDKSSNQSQRTILYNKIKLAYSLTQVRDYTSAVSSFEEARKSLEINAASDSKDSRAQGDLAGILGGEAEAYIDMADPLLNPQGTKDRRTNIKRAEALLRSSISITAGLVAVDPENQAWTAYLANEQVLLGTLEQNEKDSKASQLAATGVATLCRLASANDASSDVLSTATSAMLTVLPARLRDTKLTVRYAERLASLNHHTDPTSLLLLAQAYLADGQFGKANTTANDGLALLPTHLPGIQVVRCRLLLEHISASNDSGHRTR